MGVAANRPTTIGRGVSGCVAGGVAGADAGNRDAGDDGYLARDPDERARILRHRCQRCAEILVGNGRDTCC